MLIVATVRRQRPVQRKADVIEPVSVKIKSNNWKMSFNEHITRMYKPEKTYRNAPVWAKRVFRYTVY